MKDVRLEQLEQQLNQLTETFEREMRARGFDPAQAENAALPTSLAQLYLERESIIEQLDEIRENNEQ
jgi:hypothetical protein